jgi:OmpA-OmpF porin, OOP family
MKRMIIIIVLIYSTNLIAQFGSENLVPNPSFEEYSYCPTGFTIHQLDMVRMWRQPTGGTADYYNKCSSRMGVPDNIFGYQHANTGDGYVGIITYSPKAGNAREYMQAQLKEPLEKGTFYCVEFYVSLANYAGFMLDKIGIHFSKFPVKAGGTRVLNVKPQIENPEGNVIKNDSTWVLISSHFQAEGGEQYLTIGNFARDDQCMVLQRFLDPEEVPRVWEFGYYYIDDISVKKIPDRFSCSSTIDIIKMELPYPDEYYERYDEYHLDAVLFDFDEYVLTPETKKKLDEAVIILNRYEHFYLEINGHTDIIGRDEYNEVLSKRRATMVYDYLHAKKIPAERLRITYHGSRLPAVMDEGPEGRKQNRRVEFVILKKIHAPYNY